MAGKINQDAAPVEQEMGAIRPAGPNPTQPQGIPSGVFHVGNAFVEPLAAADRTSGELRATTDGQKIPRAPFRFVDGSLQPNLAVQYVPETILPESISDAK